LSLEGEKKSEDWQKFEEQIKDMALQVTQTAKRMDNLIESLPGVNSTEQQQLESLAELEVKNREAAKELGQKVNQAGTPLY